MTEKEPTGRLPDGAPDTASPAGDASAAQPARVPAVPWHSRGKLAHRHAKAGWISVGLVAALMALQAVLLLIFISIADVVETSMLTAQVVGFFPTGVLIVYLFCLDTIEREPVGLLLKLFLVTGVLTLFVVAYVEILVEMVERLFLNADSRLFLVVDSLVSVALVEELFKHIVLEKLTWHHPAFNYRFDGIVYATITALGFAAFENFAYILENGIRAAMFRTLSAVPGHCVDGVLMGIFYGLAKQFSVGGNEKRAKRFLLLALLVPVAEHGLYDILAESAHTLLFHGYSFLLNAVVFVLVWRLAQRDEALCRPGTAPADAGEDGAPQERG